MASTPNDPLERDRSLDIAPKWVPVLFATLGIALVPWIVILALRLPAVQPAVHYRVAWVGFDIALFATLVAVGSTALRGSTWLQPTALTAAVLLTLDAWFDIMTSASGRPMLEAILDAGLVELPLAALSLYVSRRAAAVVRTCDKMISGGRHKLARHDATSEHEAQRG